MLKRNFLYITILTMSNYIVPIVVYPYITRVLGPKGVGVIDTVESFINYAILFSMMGISTIGSREIANVRDNATERGKVFSSLFSLNLLSTFFVVIVLSILLYCVPQYKENSHLSTIGILKIIFNMFMIEWFFRGMEKFRYITLRSVCIRLLFIVSVFLFVRQSDDYIIYYMLWVGMTGCNALINWLYRKHYARFSLSGIKVHTYAKSFIYVGLFALFSAIYAQLNIFFLGQVCGYEQVGYFTMATKLYTVLIALFTALTTVMIPHMTILFQKSDERTEIHHMLICMFQLLFLFAFPATIFTEIFAPDIIHILGGDAFAPAVITMRMVMPLMFIIGTEQIFIMQVLIPLRKDSHIFYYSLAGAILCIIVDIFILKHLQGVGCAIAWITAEICVLSLASHKVWKSVHFLFPAKLFFKFCCYCTPYVLLGGGILFLCQNSIMRLGIALLLYMLYAFILEEKILHFSLVNKLFKAFKNDKS